MNTYRVLVMAGVGTLIFLWALFLFFCFCNPDD